MKKIIFLILALVAIGAISRAQNIVRGEYFFDTDPGIGNAVNFNFGNVFDSVETTLSIPANTLTQGLHVLYMRTLNDSGHWSFSEPRMLNVIANSNPNNPIASAEYFFDTDPGVGAALPLSVGTPADSVEFVPAIPVSSIATGLHVLYIRTKNTSGVWSFSEPRMVNIIQNIANSNIVAGEYFIDTDPGIGQAVTFNTGAPADSIEVTGSYPLGTLTAGNHYIYMRTKNSSGVWSLSEGRLITAFPCAPLATITNPSDTVAFCSGNPVALSADTTNAYGYLWSTGDTTQTISLNTGGVITVEVFDAFGCSALDTIYSNLGISPSFTNCADITLNSDIGQCGALVDFSGLGLVGNPFPLTTYSPNSNTFFAIGTTPVNASATNICSTETCNFNVIVIDNQIPTITAPPTANLSLSGSSCSVSNPNLGTSTSNDNCGTFTISNNAPTEFFTGSTTVTWTINDGSGNIATVDQMVNVSGNVNFGLAVNATSTNITAAPLIATFNNTTANLSNYNFVWYFGDGSILPSNAASVQHQYFFNGIYTVTLVATNTSVGCSDTLILNNYITCNVAGGAGCSHTVTTNPASVLNACIGSVVPVNASTSALNATYQWNRNGVIIGGASQDNYYITQSGNYSVTVFDNIGCPITSSPLQVNYTLPGNVAPTITAIGTPGPCGNINMTLTASAGFTNYLWNTGQNAASINVTQGGTYAVTGQSPGCDAVSLPFNILGSGAPVPPICMVTVDETDNKNVIIWEKPNSLEIDSFVVLREDVNSLGVYTQIHQQAYLELSEFKDNTSFADLRSYRYKLAVIDTCSGYTIPSSSQRSMHLEVAQGNSILTRHLNWNVYQGQQQAYTHYLIYRETAPGNLNLALIDSVPATQTWYYDNSLTNIIDTARAYMVGYRITSPCVSSRATNQLCQSNVTSNQFQFGPDGINDLFSNAFDFNIFPNPNNGVFTINLYSNNAVKQSQLKAYTILGEEVFVQNYSDARNMQLDIRSLASGIYFISLNDGKSSMQKRVVISK